jgi:hypothetical protein
MPGPPIAPESSTAGVPAVNAVHTGGAQAQSIAVQGHSDTGRGVSGSSKADYGMRAHSDRLSGIRGTSYDGVGVEGECITRPDGTSGGPAGSGGTAAGVAGSSAAGAGVVGTSTDNVGVIGTSTGGFGVRGFSTANHGVVGESTSGEGVHGISHNPDHGGVVGICDSTAGGTGVYGKCDSGNAGWFNGNVVVSGVLTVQRDVVLLGADLAEQFGVLDGADIEPGSVMVLAGEDRVRSCDGPYDRRVAGVISGAGGYRPAVIMDRQADPARRALALTGKVWCKVDAGYGSIELGDPLTTSATPGHAMRADDQARSFGAVIGKALAGLTSGCGLVPVLVALR